MATSVIDLTSDDEEPTISYSCTKTTSFAAYGKRKFENHYSINKKLKLENTFSSDFESPEIQDDIHSYRFEENSITIEDDEEEEEVEDEDDDVTEIVKEKSVHTIAKYSKTEKSNTESNKPKYTFTYDTKQPYQSVVQRAQLGINGLQKLKQRNSLNKKLYATANHEPASSHWASSVKKVEVEGKLKGELTEEQKVILDLALAGHSLFFTGAAGTGKSFVLRVLVEELQIKHGYSSVIVTASTGMAACNIQGVTLHSFAGIGIAKETKEELGLAIKKKKHVIQRWRKTSVLIIDEISMISSDFFTKIEYISRIARKSNEPFGGIQVILCGDFFQLPPVNKHDGFCFESVAWKSVPINIELKQVLRQKNPEFINILNELRLGIVSADTERILNSRVCINIPTSEIQPTKLYSTRCDVSAENKQKLDALPGKLITYTSIDEGDSHNLQQLDAHCQAPKVLELKIGAQVMLLKNLDFQSSIVNGARGVVVGFTSDRNKVGIMNPDASFYYPVVRFSDDRERIITLETWRIEMGGQVRASRVQIPLSLAYAMSIHKSQGMSIEKVDLSLANIFEDGQAYVALSRVTSLEGLRLLENFNPSKIRANSKVLQFYKHFRESNYEELASQNKFVSNIEEESEQDQKVWWSDGDDIASAYAND